MRKIEIGSTENCNNFSMTNHRLLSLVVIILEHPVYTYIDICYIFLLLYVQ